MSATRNNHYVPQWYQERFLEPGEDKLAYLDLKPTQHPSSDGRIFVGRSRFRSYPAQCFRQLDLYSTFFGTLVNDEVERRLFGDIDSRGSLAIKAFTTDDVTQWHHSFHDLFEYIDAQKIRTPKGLDWLKAQYPRLTQNDLMYEMQGIRMLHCTIWSEGIREILSAEDSDVKFIVSDHPVTIYNHALPPNAHACEYPNDPSIALKGSQTIFALDRNFCLILTNLEYGRDRRADPLAKRTFARNFRNSMVRTDAFIKSRKLSRHQVSQVNFIIKARTRRYVAAGQHAWLFPEEEISDAWADLADTLFPPSEGLWHLGGEMYASFESGHVHYQDEYGRTEKPRDFLAKPDPKRPLRPTEPCGCGSGRKFELCCKSLPLAERPTWRERSIRERNLMLHAGVVRILGLDRQKDWTQVRRDLTDEQISQIYGLYWALWPADTDILGLLPKPDGRCRAVYTGSIHPWAIAEFALGAAAYFGEVTIQHPFIHPAQLKKEFSPVENPQLFRQQVLKDIIILLNTISLVAAGVVNLVPDPSDFDPHLKDQMQKMAETRIAGARIDPSEETKLRELMEEDARRSIASLPQDTLRKKLREIDPNLSDLEVDEVMSGVDRLRESDPLAVLQANTFESGERAGQFTLAKLAPNFELSMYLAQATGSSLITDSRFRWKEVQAAISRQSVGPEPLLAELSRRIEKEQFLIPQQAGDIESLLRGDSSTEYPALMREILRYLSTVESTGPKPNFEAHLASRFSRIHSSLQHRIRKAHFTTTPGRLRCAFPLGGVQHNHVNRLLLMSTSERYLSGVPMAFFFEASKSP